MAEEELTREVYSGLLEIGPLTLTVHHLDNGQRLISAESMERFLHFMQTGEALPPPATPNESSRG